MQKEHKNIDELFKSGLSDLETKAPAFVKNRLDKKLFGKKSFFYLSITLLTIITATTVLLFNPNNDELILSENQLESNQTENITTSTFTSHIDNNQEIKTISNQKNDTEKDQNINKTFEKTILETNTHNNTNKPTASNHTMNSHQNDANSSSSQKDISLLYITNSTKDIVTTLSTKTNSSMTHTNKVDSASNELIINDPAQNDTPNTVKTNFTSDITKQNNKFQTVEVKLENSQEEEEKIEDIASTVNNLDSLSKADKFEEDIVENKLDQDSSSINHSSDNSEHKDLTFTPKPKNINYLFSLTSGLNVSKSSYSSTNTSDASYYQANNSEKINFEHNLSTNVLLKNKFIIGTGIGISKSSYDYTYTEITTSVCNCADSLTMMELIYGPNDTLQQFPPIDTLYSTYIDTINTPITTITPYNGTSSAQYVHIPFQLGYVFNLNKFMIGIQANVRYNIMYKANGHSYSNYTVTTFDKSNSIFRKSYFDFAIKTDIYYNIFDNFYANASFKYTPQLNNTFQNIPIERKLNTLHFGLGVSYKL